MANVVRMVSGKLQAETVLTTSAGAGSAGKITVLDSTGKLDTTTIPSAGFTYARELHVNYDYTGSTTNGAPLTPYKTIQAAVTAAGSTTSVAILVHLSTTLSPTEDVTISAGNNISIQGVSTTVDSQAFKLYGSITITGTSTRVRIKDMQIAPQSAVPAITINGSAGRHYFDNVTCTGGSGSITATGSYANWCELRNVTCDGAISLAGTPSAGSSFTFYGLRGTGSITVNSTNLSVQLLDTYGVTTVTHTNGNLIINELVGMGSGGIVSTCNAGSGVLLIANTIMLQANFTFALINKTGTAPYGITNVLRSEASDTLTGSRLFLGATCADSGYTPTTSSNWTSTPTNVKSALDLLASDKALSYFRIVTSSSTAYSPVLADFKNTIVLMTAATANSIVLPLNATLAVPVGYSITGVWYGTGQTSFSGESGSVIINTALSDNARIQYSSITAIKVAADTWLLAGDLAAP